MKPTAISVVPESISEMLTRSTKKPIEPITVNTDPPSNLREESRKLWAKFNEKQSNFSGENLNFIPPIVKYGRKICVIDPEDVVKEASNWGNSVICAVLGSKPPLQVFEGFVRCIWADFGVDKVLRLDSGHFLWNMLGILSLTWHMVL